MSIGLAVLRRKRETEWMRKLRTVYPYGLNDRVDMYNDDNQAFRLNNDDDLVGKVFPSLPRQYQRDPRYRHNNRNGLQNINYETFVREIHQHVTTDLPNASNYIRISLSSVNKKHSKRIADYINDFLNNNSSEFPYIQWYLMALDIIECKLFKEPKQTKKRSPPKYKCNITFSNKALDYINLPKILRSNEASSNLPSNFCESDIPMVVYSLNSSIRSKLFNYKRFVEDLDINKFVENTNSVSCCCSKYDKSFTNHQYGHIVTGDLNIVNNDKLRKMIKKGPKYREPKQLDFEDAREQITSGLSQFIENLSSDKGVHKNHFSQWKSTILSLVDNKIELLKNKIRITSVKSAFSDTLVRQNLNSLKNDFVIVPIDKAANNVAFVCKQFYAFVISKELGVFDQINLNDNTYQRVTNQTSKDIIEDHKKYQAKFNLKLNNDMNKLPVMYWIPKMHKNPISFRFIIASPTCSIKPLSKDITSIFKLFYKKVERYHNKGRLWSGVKTFWTIQNNSSLINTVNKLNTRKSAKRMSTFDFSTLYTKIPHDKLLHVLSEITDFAFKGGTRSHVVVYNSGAHWSNSKSTHGRSYSLQQIKSSLQYLLNNCYFQVGTNIFRQVIGIPMGSDPAPFFANLFLFYYESMWLKSIKNQQYGKARKFGNVFRFIDDLIAINDGGEFEANFKEIYPSELLLKKENTSCTEATFLDLHLSITDGHIKTKLYDKRDAFNFDIVRFPYKDSTIPSKMFFSTISAEILRICRANTSKEFFVETSKRFIQRMLTQGADPFRIKKVLTKMMNRHSADFLKFSTSGNHLIESIIPTL